MGLCNMCIYTFKSQKTVQKEQEWPYLSNNTSDKFYELTIICYKQLFVNIINVLECTFYASNCEGYSSRKRSNYVIL